jgi:hypothetical protein
MACKVSGRVLDREIFRKQLPTFIMQSWTGTTQKQYKHYIELWSSFCCGQQTDPYDPPVGKFLDFLVTLYDKGYKYSGLTLKLLMLIALVSAQRGQSLQSLLRFRSLLKEHYLTASQTIFDSDDPRTWKSVCLKCNSARILRISTSCCS